MKMMKKMPSNVMYMADYHELMLALDDGKVDAGTPVCYCPHPCRVWAVSLSSRKYEFAFKFSEISSTE